MCVCLYSFAVSGFRFSRLVERQIFSVCKVTFSDLQDLPGTGTVHEFLVSAFDKINAEPWRTGAAGGDGQKSTCTFNTLVFHL